MVIQLKVTHSKKMRIEIRWQIHISWNSWSMLLLTFVKRAAGLTRGNALGHWPVDLPMFMKLLLVYMTWDSTCRCAYGLFHRYPTFIPPLEYDLLSVCIYAAVWQRGEVQARRTSSDWSLKKRHANPENKPGNHMVNWSDWQEELPFFRSSYYTLAIPSKIVKWQVLASQSLYDFLTI